MNHKSLVSDNFSYKYAWQGAKQLCTGLRIRFFCMLFLFVLCSAIALFGIHLLFPKYQVALVSGQVLAHGLWSKIGVAMMLVFCIMITFLMFNIYKLFLSIKKQQNPQYFYKVSLRDCIGGVATYVCVLVIASGIGTVVLHILGPCGYGRLCVSIPVRVFSIVIGIVISIVVLGFVNLMFVHRIYSGASWINALKFSIARVLRYTWRWLVLMLFCSIMLLIFAALMFAPVILFLCAFMLLGEMSLHDVLSTGLGHIALVFAQGVGVTFLIFMFLRYCPLVMSLPCSIYLRSYTAGDVKPVFDDVRKDDIWRYIVIALFGLCVLAFFAFCFLLLLASF